MKKTLILGLLGAAVLTSCNSTSSTPKTELDSVAYSYGAFVGLNIAQEMTTIDSEIDPEMVANALRDALNDNSKMTIEEAYAFLNEYTQVRKPAKALKESEEFLAKKEKEANVQKTESGLLYEIISEGGEKATNDADTVVVLYTGTLADGTKFDSTDDRGGEPAVFPLNGVIPAWTEGMKLVGKGGKIKLYAHPDLAYGAHVRPGSPIGANQALQFEVEIVDVKPVVEKE